MVAVDTLVHNFLRRTGIMQGCGTPHTYGAACYGRGGYAEIIRTVSTQSTEPSSDTNVVYLVDLDE